MSRQKRVQQAAKSSAAEVRPALPAGSMLPEEAVRAKRGSAEAPSLERQYAGPVHAVFMIWCAVGLLVLLLRYELPAWMLWADAFFLFLAALNMLLATAARDEWEATLKSFVIVVLGSGTIEAVGAATGWPFGSYHYSDRLGMKLFGLVPWTIPLAWWAVLSCGHHFAALLMPRRPRWGCALAVATFAALFDAVMEPFAWHVKGYWIWHSGSVPMQNYEAWWCVAFVLSALCPWGCRPLTRVDPRPFVVAVGMLATFFLGRVLGPG